MSPPLEANVGESLGFKWGTKMGVDVKNKDIQYYESFVLEGVEYFLYDCVYMQTTGFLETSIAKLLKIYERPTREKVVRVVWYFRPVEIRNYLAQYQPRWDELFLASGEGHKGAANDVALESILGKCKIVCTSKDERNPKPLDTDLKKADYFFKCTFDVASRVIMDKFPKEIDGVKVEQFFNKNGDEKTSSHLHVGTNMRPKVVIKTRTDPCIISHCQVSDKAEMRTSVNVLPKQSPDYFPNKKRKIVEEKPTIGRSSQVLNEEEIDEKKVELRQDERVKTYNKVIEVMKRPDAPWDDRLQRAQELNTLVLLNNLDPSYTSSEVEDLVWCALKAKVEARMIEWRPTSNTYYGRALVIFKTKDAAETAISELNKRCLTLGEGRIVSAMKGTLSEPAKKRNFTGHLVIDRAARHKQSQEMRNAVSTSHCSQPNTIEFEMAIEWKLQYEKFNACWNALHQVGSIVINYFLCLGWTV
uniref:BAH domain-containing protein n=1 Tax=Cajanus cajan TaxID=3821 RepID=A0A151SXU4_CAJCA|nr:hypothetical protein KK1_015019 [Cajanus cajan]